MTQLGRPPRSTLTVCIPTFERPTHLDNCLSSLVAQRDPVDQIVIVDASAKPSPRLPQRQAVPDLVYRHRPDLAGWMTRSRNAALLDATGDVIAFLDDDVRPRPEWAAAMRGAFADLTVLAAAGRTLNGIAGEEHYGEPIGRVRADGTLSSGFAAHVDRIIDVDHGIGANMAFRRSTLAELGGFRDDYPGPALREDTDIFLRIKQIGGRAVFVPDAVVYERAAPHVIGTRFDTRYKYYGRRNHVVLLGRVFGIGSPVLRHYLHSELSRALTGAPLGPRRRAERLGITLIGLAGGMAALPGTARWHPSPAERTDPAAEVIRGRLGERTPSC